MEATDLLRSSWAHIVHTYPPNWIEVAIVLLGQLLGYWLPSTLFLALDLSFPAWSSRYKLQSEKRQPSWPAVRHCIRRVARAFALQTALQLLAQALAPRAPPFRVRPDFPPLSEFLAHFAWGVLAREALFYGAHRAMHHPALYARIHKQHHVFTAPMAFAAQYAHPVEHLLVNALPIFVPMAVCRAHILTFAAFFVYELLQTTTSHCGYRVFWNARLHDRHHEKFRVNYGTIGLVDWLLGTDQEGWDRMGEGERRGLERDADALREAKAKVS